MQRESHRAPASRRSKRATRTLPPLLLTFFLAALATFAPACGGRSTESTETAPPYTGSQTLTAPGLSDGLVSTKPVTDEETAAARQALEDFERLSADPAVTDIGNLAPLEQFVAAHPTSGWVPGMKLNLGLAYYRVGYFSRALSALEETWNEGKASEDVRAHALVDRALGELLKMHSRVGHLEEVDALLEESAQRPIYGSATELRTSAKEAAWTMHSNPGVAFLCGPKALANVFRALGKMPPALLDAEQSGPNGYTLTEVGALADKAELPHRLIFRAPGQAIPVPSVVNWNLHHYAAIVGQEGDRFHVQDPTFGTDLLVTAAAIDAESSGFFLVPSDATSDAAWRDATPEEADAAYGKGYTTSIYSYATSVFDVLMSALSGPKPGTLPVENPGDKLCKSTPMCAPNAQMMVVGLNLNDTPVGYQPQLGPPVFVRLTYSQREAAQPSTFAYTNISVKWTINFLSYITDIPNSAGTSVTRYVTGGGLMSYSGYSGGTGGSFSPERQTGAKLTRNAPGGTFSSYTLKETDGSVLTYATVDGATGGTSRNVFLTNVTDPQGQSLTLNYNSLSSMAAGTTCPTGGCQMLASITDAAGRTAITFNYAVPNTVPGYQRMVSSITDYSGRTASLAYDSSGRLSSITDVYGITSSFTYDDLHSPARPNFIKQLVTPYGTSSFDYEDPTLMGYYQRWLELTDTLGHKERVELYEPDPSHSITGVDGYDTTAPSGSGLDIYNSSTVTRAQYRNTFYWDKHVYPTYGVMGSQNYAKARRIHWLHTACNDPGGLAISGTPESILDPYESRVWYNYTGQANIGCSPYELFESPLGSIDTVSAMARVLDSSDTQLVTATYNSIGKPLTLNDAYRVAANSNSSGTPHNDGRQDIFTYESTGVGTDIDLKKVERKTSHANTPSTDTLAQYTYTDATITTSLHEPVTYIDAGGNKWRYCYNTRGQLTQAIDPANYSSGTACGGYSSSGTTYTYEGSAPYRLTTITNAAGHTAYSFTYDSSCTSHHVTCDLPQTVTGPDGMVTTYAYDVLDRVTSATDGRGLSDTYSFANLDLAAHADKLGRLTTYTYDTERRLTRVTEPLGTYVQYGYYNNGTLATLTDQNGNVTTWDRTDGSSHPDVESRVRLKTFPNGTSVGYTYETNTSRLLRFTDQAGKTKTYSYYDDDMLAGITYTAADTPPVTFSVEDFYPRRSGMSDGNGSTTFSYVPVGTNGALQSWVETPPFTHSTVTLTYDVDGRVSSQTVGETSAEMFTYDALGRVSTHVTDLGTFTYSGYLAETGLPTSRTLGSSSTTQSWTYNADSNVRRLDTLSPGNSKARKFTLGFLPPSSSAASQWNPYDVASVTESAGDTAGHPWNPRTYEYTYDAQDRLLSAQESCNPAGGTTCNASSVYVYGFDPAANLTTFTSPTDSYNPTYNNENQLTDTWADHYQWNSTGEYKENNSIRFNTWTGENQPDTLYVNSPAAVQTQYWYDGLGRRVKQNYYDGVHSTDTYYTWCGGHICGKREGANHTIARYFEEGQANLNTSEVVTSKWLTSKDQSGSVRDIIDTSGTLVGSVDYTPYGQILRSTGSLPDFLFGGLMWDANMQYYLSETRIYDPFQGRWWQRDPIAERGGINLYEYANGNPISTVDPSGLAPGAVGVLLPRLLGPGATLLGVTVTASEAANALARDSRNPEKTYQTYTRYNPSTGQTYVGRTSGYGTPEENLRTRYRSDHDLTDQGFEEPQLDQTSKSYCAIRGREQDLIDSFGAGKGIGSPNLANKNNGVSDWNPLGPYYIMRSHAEFGPVLPIH